MVLRHFLLFILIGIFPLGCMDQSKEQMPTINTLAEDYVKLVLEIGQYDEAFVDAYYGPEEWKPAPSDSVGEFPYEELKWRATELLTGLEELSESFDSLEIVRFRYLISQLIAVKTRLAMIMGEHLPFDVESRALYDATTPHYDQDYYDDLLAELDNYLPGSGSITTRYNDFRSQFIIPPEKVDDVFQAAIAEAKKRTGQFIDLPENERFDLEYVTDKPWSGYNWYKGDFYSLIQINTDLPIYIDRAIDLACHEGYPGHHVYNVMLEKHLVKDKGWMEFSVYPLFSPQSLIAEGSANYGIEMAFPAQERIDFERESLFPKAGLNPAYVEKYYEVENIRSKLNYAGNEAAMRYLNGEIDSEEAIQWLMRYALFSKERAEQRLRFIETYRSYVINYNYGKDLVRNYIERQLEHGEDTERRWKLFTEVLSTPLTASMLD